MTHWESFPFLLVGFALAALGLFALCANPRTKPNRLFALFLFMVAANFATDWIGDAYLLYDPNKGVVTDPWYQVSHAINLLDAAALLWFAATYPLPTKLEKRPWVRFLAVGVLAAHLAYALLFPLDAAAGRPFWAKVAETAVFAVVYLAALGLAVRSLVAAEYASTRQAARPLVAGLLVAVATRIGLLESDFQVYRSIGGGGSLAIRLPVTWLVFAVAVVALRLLEPAAERRNTQPWIAAAAAMTAGVSVLWTGLALFTAYNGSVASSLLYTARWLLFAVLVTYALSRHSFLGAKPRFLAPLRSGASLLVATAAFAALHVLLGPLQGHSPGMSAGDVLAAGGSVLVAIGLLVGPRAPVHFPAANPAQDPLRTRKVEAYRALLEADLQSGGDGAGADLAEHRHRLGLHEDDHRGILALILAEATVQEARGPRGALPPGYRLEEVFPSGARTWTVLARDPKGQRAVVKTLRREWRPHSAVAAAFVEEGRLLARIRHPNVVRVLQAFQSPPALALEHAPGGNLAERVRRSGPLAPAEVERIARDLLAGLGALHDAGIVHRDLKPENVLFAADGRALIADFGAALETSGGTQVLHALGTAEAGTVLYMAPEQVLGQATDARTDLYALGAVIVFAATGKHYLHLETMAEFDMKQAIMTKEVEVPVSVARNVRLLVKACLRKDKGRRPNIAFALALL